MVIVDGFRAFFMFSVCLIDPVTVGLWSLTGKPPENPRKIGRVGESAGPRDFGHVERGGFKCVDGSLDADALDVVDQFFTRFGVEQVGEVICGTLHAFGDGFDVELGIGNLLPDEPFYLKNLSDVPVHGFAGGFDSVEQGPQQSDHQSLDNVLFGWGIHMECLRKLITVCQNLHQVGSVEEKNMLDVRAPGRGFERKMEADGITVKSADKISEPIVIRCYAFTMRESRRDNAAIIRLNAYLFSRKVESCFSVDLEKQFGVEVEVHARMFLHPAFRLRDF